MEKNEGNLLDELRAFWETDEGKASLENFKQEQKDKEVKTENIKTITNLRLDRFHSYLKDNNISFGDVYLHIKSKYSSKEYKKRFPNYNEPCSLYSFLYDYVVRFGREVSEKEYEHYTNGSCNGDMYYIDDTSKLCSTGYYLSTSYGQGENYINFIKEDKTKDFSNYIILDKIYRYLEKDKDNNLRFGQVLSNLNINMFADTENPSNKDYLLKDIYSDSNKNILKRMKI